MDKKYQKYIVDIQGKPYMTVAGRLAMFWDDVANTHSMHPASIVTEVTVNDKQILTKATATIGARTATGWAMEVIGDGFINKTSAVENCESSAVGRALGNLGYGLLEAGGVASADEVQGAMSKQTMPDRPKASPFKKATPKQVNFIKKLATEKGETIQGVEDFDASQASQTIERLIAKPSVDTSRFNVEDHVDYGPEE